MGADAGYTDVNLIGTRNEQRFSYNLGNDVDEKTAAMYDSATRVYRENIPRYQAASLITMHVRWLKIQNLGAQGHS